MIFVTVGSQMPFDRLVQAIDDWAHLHPSQQVFAQIGQTRLRPDYIEYCESLSPSEFRARVKQAEVVIAHAGMGSVLTALEFAKPLVVVPRRGDLRETRNDHQIATARWLAQRPGIAVAMDSRDLPLALDRVMTLGTAAWADSIDSDALVGFLRSYLAKVVAGRSSN